ncbi:hypothetical protein, partial [Enterococcus faecium]|uniref:hypothetical protein n=1 Tax=Enterococcus faecium TaxID=1352 RepID=UPI0034E97343
KLLADFSFDLAELVSGIDDSSVPTVDAVDVVDASLSELDSFESEVTLSEVEDSVTVSTESLLVSWVVSDCTESFPSAASTVTTGVASGEFNKTNKDT